MKVAEEIAGERMYTKDDLALILGEAAVEINKAIDEARLPFDQELKDKCKSIIESAFIKNL